MGNIHIGKPKIRCVQSPVLGKAARLYAPVEWDNPKTGLSEVKECYFDVEEPFGRYLTLERSDAFVMGLLTMAMENDCNIEFEMPMSRKLFFQMNQYYIPIVAKYNHKMGMHNISLIGKTEDSMLLSQNAVATGCSAGVDSIYTILRHGIRSNSDHEYKLTHLVCSSSGTLDFDNDRIIKTYRNVCWRMRMIAKETGLTAVACFNNLHEFYDYPYRGFSNFYATTYGATAYALQHLFSVYYQSTSYNIDSFALDLSKTHGKDGSVFDSFTIPNMNTENLTFYQGGAEVTRLEKTEYLADIPFAQQYLSVCGVEYSGGNSTAGTCNCSRCRKCLRTMSYLHALGKLKEFKSVFDVADFYKNTNRRIGKWMAIDKKEFEADYEKTAEKYGVKISKAVYFYAMVYKVFLVIKNLLSNSSVARKIYYKFNLDYKLYGYRDAKYEETEKNLYH